MPVRRKQPGTPIAKPRPQARYLDLLDDKQLPQNSDAVLVMVQHESALAAFEQRYYKYLRDLGEHRRITTDTLEELGQYGSCDDD